MNQIVYLSPSCHHLSKQDKEYITAYIFIKQLSAFTNHPILFDFDANSARIRHLLHFTPHRFTKLLNAALRLDLCRYEGKNLRLISKTQERKLFDLRSARNYEPVKVEHVKQYIQIQILKQSPKSQQKGINHKIRSAGTFSSGHCERKEINTDITLSCQNAAKLLGFKSRSYAHTLLTKLSGFGLQLSPNRKEISTAEYYRLKDEGSYNARRDRETGNFYFLSANTVHFSKFYPLPIVKSKGTAYYNNQYW